MTAEVERGAESARFAFQPVRMISFFIWIFGCSSEGLGSVTSADDAPWSMNDAVTFLFTPGPDNNGRRGSAVLAISTDAGHDCTDVETGPPAGGSGLWFVVGYDTGRSEGAASPAWDGLYASGDVKGGGVGCQPVADLQWVAPRIRHSFENSDSWLNVSHGSQNKVPRTLLHDWWSGEFDAGYARRLGPVR